MPRPKRKATNAHIFRYLQTSNPGRLEETDLKKALEASLEECPDFWPEDTASCSSSDQSNGTSASSTTSIERGIKSSTKSQRLYHHHHSAPPGASKRKSKSTMQHNHLNQLCNCHHHQSNHPTNHHASTNCTANHPYQYCPMSCSYRPNRYKPVAKKNVYNEADFFHEGIMEYIQFELETMIAKRKATNSAE